MEDSTAEAGVEEAITTTDDLEKVIQPAPEPATDDSEQAEHKETASDETGEAESEEEAVEEIEFDFGGNKLKVPKDSVPEEVREQLDKFTKGTWSDYTKKSQAVAEQKKALEARETAVQKFSTMQGEALDSYSKGLKLKAELEQLQQINLNELWQSDPDQARQHSDVISQKQAEFNSVINQVSQSEQKLAEAQQQEHSRLFDEGKKTIEKRIKGFEAKAPEVIDYVVKTYGVDRETAKRTWALNPGAAEMGYKAMLFDRMQSQVKNKTKPKPVEAVAIKAVRGSGNKATKDPSKMNPEEYRAMRLKQKQIK